MTKNKRELEKRVKQLEEQLINSKIKKHKDNYIQIPAPNRLALAGALFAGLLSWLNLQLIFLLWARLEIDVIAGLIASLIDSFGLILIIALIVGLIIDLSNG